MPKTAPGAEINLLPQEQLRQEPISKFLRWALTAGRYIVIFTEALVLIVFLARFKLDSDIIDLKQEITAKAQVLKQAQNFEEEFLATQKRLIDVGRLFDNLEPRAPLLTTIEATIPQPITLAELSLTGSKLQITGVSTDYAAITQWVKLLEAEESLSEVSLDSLQRSTEEAEGDSLIQFSISVGLRGDQKGSTQGASQLEDGG